MSLFLVLLAAGDSKRFNSNTPKPFYKINNKTLLEHSFNAFSSFIKIKKTIIVYNKRHKKYLNKIPFDLFKANIFCNFYISILLSFKKIQI